MDAVGASSLPEALVLVRPGGSFVSIPTLVDDGDIPASMAAAAERGVHRVFSTMDDVDSGAMLTEIVSLVARGEVQLPPISELRLTEAAQAHRLLEEGRHRGKIVLRVADL